MKITYEELSRLVKEGLLEPGKIYTLDSKPIDISKWKNFHVSEVKK